MATHFKESGITHFVHYTSFGLTANQTMHTLKPMALVYVYTRLVVLDIFSQRKWVYCVFS